MVWLTAMPVLLVTKAFIDSVMGETSREEVLAGKSMQHALGYEDETTSAHH
jgi:hypothetical protein